jgi:protein-disulfide isomerase
MSNLSVEKTVPRSVALFGVLALLGLGAFLPACSAQGSNGGGEAAGGDEVVAQIDGKPVTMADLEEAASPQLKRLEAERHKILESTLSQVVEQRLLEAEAEARGVSVEELLKAEVEDKISEVTDEDVDKWYEENKERVRRPKEEVAEQIKRFLEQQQGGEVRNTFLASLREKHSVRVLLEPPRADVEVADAPTKGPADAPVTIVEFSDFECPFCGRVNPTLEQVEATYGDKVRIAFRQFPLAMHPNAQKAAEASLCAKEQGKFWEMHDKLFGNQRALAVDNLKQYAADLELDTEQFNSCLDDAKYADAVAEDMAAGQAAGVSGTPAMFINGRLVSGAVPFDQIAQVIDDELQRKDAE